MTDDSAGCVTEGDALHSAREAPRALWRKAIAEIWLLEIRAAFAVRGCH